MREMIFAVCVALAVILAALVIVFALRPSPEERATLTANAALGARRWADRLGMPITGVDCDRVTCTIAPVGATPFRAFCNADGCTLETCK
mgnify:FL=1